jgi:hypothetical protein
MSQAADGEIFARALKQTPRYADFVPFLRFAKQTPAEGCHHQVAYDTELERKLNRFAKYRRSCKLAEGTAKVGRWRTQATCRLRES